MSIEARREYLNAIWERYGKAKRREKTAILNEYVQEAMRPRGYGGTRRSSYLLKHRIPI